MYLKSHELNWIKLNLTKFTWIHLHLPEFMRIHMNLREFTSHVFVGPLSPGAALIVKSWDTKFLIKYYLYHSGNFYKTFMALGLLESGPWLKFGALGGPWDAPCRPSRHSKKVRHLQEVIKNVYGKGLGLWAGPWGPKEEPTRPMKALQGPPGTMIRKFKHNYFWQLTGDKWQVPCDMWHVTNDTWCGVNILSKFQLSSSNGFELMMLWISGRKRWLTHWLN